MFFSLLQPPPLHLLHVVLILGCSCQNRVPILGRSSSFPRCCCSQSQRCCPISPLFSWFALQAPHILRMFFRVHPHPLPYPLPSAPGPCSSAFSHLFSLLCCPVRRRLAPCSSPSSFFSTFALTVRPHRTKMARHAMGMGF